MKTSGVIFKNLTKVVIHILFWVVVYFFYTYFLGYGSTNTEYVNLYSLFLMPITIVTSYFFFFYLIPKYLLKNKQGFFVLYSVYTFLISSFFVVLSILYGYILLINLQLESSQPLTRTIPYIYLSVYFVIFIVITIGLIVHNYKSVVKNEDLKNKFLQTQLQLKEQELKFLKMQIHPHFLFNTLNTLYGFALKKSEETPEMILKLSNLLDYILYQIEKPKVLLFDEIQHIKNYISLEKMRFQDSLHITFNVEGEYSNFQIAPMLLLPFVENSFKHGALIDGVLIINIQLKTSAKELNFSIQNQLKEKEESVAGIGLENSKKRLEILYKEAYQLEIDTSKNMFKVSLKVPSK